MHRSVIRKLIALRQVYEKESAMHREAVNSVKAKLMKHSKTVYSYIEHDIDGIGRFIEEVGDSDG